MASPRAQNAGSRAHREALGRLARLHGVQTSYRAASGERRSASPQALSAVLDSLGSPAATPSQALRSLRERVTSLRSRRIEPVTVVWSGRRAAVEINVAHAAWSGRAEWTLRLEDGGVRTGGAIPRSQAARTTIGRNGSGRASVRLLLPRELPTGYHRLTLSSGRERCESLVVCAPERSYPGGDEEERRAWGVFCPTYALRSSRDWGCGTLSDLCKLGELGQSLGASVVSTLPLLAAHLDDPFDPSPYAPVSRLFWNELFVDPTRAPEFPGCEPARRLAASAAFQRAAAGLRRAPLVDYRAAGRLKRLALGLLAEHFFQVGGDRSARFRAFEQANPLLREYAAFRASEAPPSPPGGGRARPGWSGIFGDEASAARRTPVAERKYHLYAQFLASRQLDELSGRLSSRGVRLYLDLPVGVGRRSFDVRHWPGQFAMSCSTGAPPDPSFTAGQDWGFPPPHPERQREDGYAYLIATLRNHMRYAGMLRLDHVMAFHRLFWVPSGMGPAEGVYVRYPAEELFAILCLESHRGRCRLVGENLGTVPPEVESRLERHGLGGLYVAQIEARPRSSAALRRPPRGCTASLNTHDMPPLAAWWDGRDIDDRIALGALPADRRESEHRERRRVTAALVKFLRKKRLLRGPARGGGRATPSAASVRGAMLAFLGVGAAELMLVNIEDLWLERRWQNVPETSDEHPNWRRRLRFSLAQLRKGKGIARLLRRVDAARRMPSR